MTLRTQLIMRPEQRTDVLRHLPWAPDFHQSSERLLWLARQGFDPRLVTVEHGGTIAAAAIFEKTAERWFLWKGPAGEPPAPEVLAALLEACAVLRPVTLVLRPEWVHHGVLRDAGYANDGTFATLLVAGHGGAEAILARMKDSARRRVKRGIRAGLEFSDDASRFQQFYRVYADSMSAAGSPDFAAEKEMESLLAVPRVHLFLALLGDEVVAGSVCFEQEDALEARYVATHAAYRNIAPLNFVHFKSLEWGARAGLRYLDLSGLATGPMDPKVANINRFKEGFGGVRYDYPIFRRT